MNNNDDNDDDEFGLGNHYGNEITVPLLSLLRQDILHPRAVHGTPIYKPYVMDIQANELVIKYGHEIGYAEKKIHKGEWVHTQNMGCRRGK